MRGDMRMIPKYIWGNCNYREKPSVYPGTMAKLEWFPSYPLLFLNKAVVPKANIYRFSPLFSLSNGTVRKSCHHFYNIKVDGNKKFSRTWLRYLTNNGALIIKTWTKTSLSFRKLALALKILNLFSEKWNVTFIFVC